MPPLRFLICLLVLVFVSARDSSAADKKKFVAKELPAFPGAVGYGSKTAGGSGRHLKNPKSTVYRVSSLGDSGPGSLRECVEGAGPRVCIFETSGRIRLRSLLEVKNPYLTIAGQTAPSPGIMISGAALKISTNDVVVRHLAIRVGDDPVGPPPPARDAVTINGPASPAFNIVLDHLSLSWALDENLGIYGKEVRDVTVMNSILAEGLHRSIHPDGPHSKGVLVGDDAQRISIHDCLLAHNEDRNPRQKPGSSLEFVNNVVYNWGGRGSGHQANPSDTENTNKVTLLLFAGNYYKAGPQSPDRAPLYAKPVSPGFRAFVKNNFGPSRERNDDDEWKIAAIPEEPYRAATSPLPPSGVVIRSAAETYSSVLETAGARSKDRDTVDQRIISEVKQGTGSIKDCVAACPKDSGGNSIGGWPEIAEIKRQLKLPQHPQRDTDHNGYTDLEDWLNSL